MWFVGETARANQHFPGAPVAAAVTDGMANRLERPRPPNDLGGFFIASR
jgi:hypothetical protein